MSFKKKYKFDNTNTLILLTDENNIKKYNDLDKFIGNLKKNKKEYAKLVLILAITIPRNSYAASNDLGLGSVAAEIVNMIMVFGKYGCLRQRDVMYVSRNATRSKFKAVFWGRHTILYFLYNT